MKKIIKKIILIIVPLFLIAISISCNNSYTYESNEVLDVEQKEIIEEETTKSEEDDQFYGVEEIDFTNVTGEGNITNLTKINDINLLIGKDVYVTKEDFFGFNNIKISLIGDMTAEKSKSYLKSYFKNIHQVTIQGKEMNEALGIFDEMNNLNEVGEILIVSIANSSEKGLEIDVLKQLHQKLNGKPMIIPTIVMQYKGQERNRNRELLAFAKEYDNCYIADWNKINKLSENLLSENGVLPNSLGEAVFSQLMFKKAVEIMKKKYS